MFAEIATVVEQYLENAVSLAELRDWQASHTTALLATTDKAAERLDAGLLSGFALLDDNALTPEEFRQDLHAALLEARSLAA
ncbi:MAG: hypothetical protein WD645_04400 [Dehalococcoidia bacterium]